MSRRLCLACLLSALPWGAMAAEPLTETSVAPVSAVPAKHDRLVQLLNDMQKTRDADFFAASTYMLESSGDELAFVRHMQTLAEQEHPVAMYWVALRQDPAHGEESFRLLQTSVQAYTPAIVALAKLVHDGWDGQAPDEWLAKDMLLRACKIGSAEARALYLKWGWLDGPVVDLTGAEVSSELKRHNYYLEEYMAARPSPERDWWTEASAHGSPRAAFEKFLQAEDSSSAEAQAYLRLSAERHYPLAMERLGCFLYAAAEPGSADAQNGLNLLRQAAATGDDPHAVALVGLAYAYCIMGHGEQEASSATDAARRIAELFHFAHGKGDALGTAGWGYCLVVGKGCTQDVRQGLALLESAVATHPRFANLALYHLYADGAGVEPDPQKASQYKERYEAAPAASGDIWLFATDSAAAPFMPALE